MAKYNVPPAKMLPGAKLPQTTFFNDDEEPSKLRRPDVELHAILNEMDRLTEEFGSEKIVARRDRK